jgi:hypothetical protein
MGEGLKHIAEATGKEAITQQCQRNAQLWIAATIPAR